MTFPPIKWGPGNVVTGKFIHESDGNLINLRIKGQREPTTVTSNHRYWSADRKEFVEAGHLKPGEQVSTLSGLKQVVSITPRTGNETVYNLEVQGEHVYLVGSLGTLVHNTYPLKKIPLPTIKGAGKIADPVPKYVPKNWSKGNIEDAIVDYRGSIRIRKAEAADFDAIGGGHIWSRKSHYERITDEENFLHQLQSYLGDL